MCSLCRRFGGECELHSALLIDSPVISGSFISKKMPSHLKQWKHLPLVQRFSIMCWSGFAEGCCWEGWAALRYPAAVYRSSCSDQPVTFSGVTETLFSNQLHTSAELEAPGFGISDKNTWGHHFLNFSSFKAYEEVRCRRHEGIRCCLCRVTAVKALVSSWTLSFPKWSQISFNAQTQPENESWQRDLSDEAAKDVIFR